MEAIEIFLVVVIVVPQQAAAFTYQQSGYWTTSDCSGAPFYMDIFPEFNCGQRNITYDCSSYTFNSTEYYRTVICVADTQEWTKSYYKTTDYVMMEQFNMSAGDCDDYFEGRVFLANDSCIKMINSTSYQSAIASVGSDGSESLELFEDNACSTTAAKSFSVVSSVVEEHSCYDGEYKFYSESDYTSGSGAFGNRDNKSDGNPDGGSSGGTGSSGQNADTKSASGLSTGASVVIVVVGLVVTVVCCIVFWCRRRSKKKNQQLTSSTVPEDVGNFVNAVLAMEIPPTNAATINSSRGGGEGGSEEESALWRDEAILGARVPREKVVVKRLISRGGYGEVYMGTYNRQRVAVKMLLPETRKSKAHRISFLAEVKLMATLEHPRIVRLVGVAWDSPNDLCALIEFVSGGDLRALLSKYEKEHRPIGFTYEKVKIAFHVAHAITYLHTLSPPVIHRDLKSKNILLTNELDAKLTDFGVSRERADRTMTAAVGTSLWMSPEVMMGERYNDKADIFSFGIVLSELNTHAMPYAHAKSRDGSNERLPDTAILQLVAAGRLRADFSQGGPQSIMDLGLSCVAVDPKSRPTAPEVLHRLQNVMRDITS
ncbi:hypothetical protein ON010_g10311 [Phytophthora cinnamomi]|nr:hypothetical protein ON010_g10311 [Phytophthora cinnamomi]